MTRTAHDQRHTFDGWAAARGVDPWSLPDRRLINLVEHWLKLDRTEAQIAEIDALLNETPASEDDPGWSADAELALFGQAMSRPR